MNVQGLFRWLSLVWPVRMRTIQGAHGPLELSWEYGRLVVNSAHANQSLGSLHRVWRAAFRDATIQQRDPASTLVLGYGAGSVERILHAELGLRTRITGVDDDPEMLRLSGEHFPAAAPTLVELIQADALEFVTRHSGTFDLIVVDLFHDLDLAPGVDEPRAIIPIRRLASPGGVVLVNSVVHDNTSALRSARLRDELRLHFAEVLERRYEETNRVYIAL